MASAFVPKEFWWQDEWFATNHARNVTAAFEAWWLEFYGTPDDYSPGADEQHEYFVRAAFALMGWAAGVGSVAGTVQGMADARARHDEAEADAFWAALQSDKAEGRGLWAQDTREGE